MHKHVLFYTLITILLMIFMFNAFAANNKPNLVISSIRFINQKSGVFYPEISVDNDGTWREATISDIWIGQEFKLFIANNKKRECLNNGFDVIVNNVNDIIGKFQSQAQPNKGNWYFGVYYNNANFSNKGIGKLIKPELVNPIIENDFKQLDKSIANRKAVLEKIVKVDWKNIKNDFPKLASQNIESFITGDINGDNIKDYILILGENTFGSSNSGPAAVIIYLVNNGKRERIPVSFWESTSDENSFPELLFTRDFNGDKAEELFLADSDTDTETPIVYSWFKEKNGFMMLYRGAHELWH